jgi:biopolymer transport protein ExbB
MEFLYTVAQFFQDGGPFMYPIAFVLFVGLAIMLERWFYLSRAKVRNRRAYEAMLPLLRKSEFGGVLALSESTDAPVSRILAAGINRLQHTTTRENIEYAMEESVMEALPRLEKRTQYLATLANVATLLGLLGTIIGLISAFTAVANADPTEKATLLSQSISVAMNTTAFGLMSAIPLLLAHAVLQSKTSQIVDGLEMAGVKFLNLLVDSQAPLEQPWAAGDAGKP